MLVGVVLLLATPTIALLRSASGRARIILRDTKQDEDITSEKLVWDPKQNRFYEAKVDQILEEEFCLIDKDTGMKSIILEQSYNYSLILLLLLYR